MHEDKKTHLVGLWVNRNVLGAKISLKLSVILIVKELLYELVDALDDGALRIKYVDKLPCVCDLD